MAKFIAEKGEAVNGIGKAKPYYEEAKAILFD